MDKTLIIFIGMFFVVLSICILWAYPLQAEKMEELRKNTYLGCDYLINDSFKGNIIGCSEKIYYDRIKEIGLNGTYCFKNYLDYVILKCKSDNELNIVRVLKEK